MTKDSKVDGDSRSIVTSPARSELTIAQSLEEATPALRFNEPLLYGDSRWIDLSPARADRARNSIVKKLRRRSPGQMCHIALVSHRGMGKSTELRHLQNDLNDRYTMLYFEANTEMDPVTIGREDLLLVLAQGVEEYMRLQGLSLDHDLMERIAGWFAEVTEIERWMEQGKLDVSGEAQIGGKIPFLGKLLAGFKSLLRIESDTRKTVTQTLRQHPGTLLRSVNELLDDANKQLVGAGRGELLILIDNLDRYHPQMIDELLIQGGDQIRKLRCNLILTPPISLQYQPKSKRLSLYFDVEVMHAPRLRRSDQPYDEFDGPGRDLFRRVLMQRIDLDALLPDPAAQSRLISATGGSIRDLIRFAYEASLLPDDPPMTRDDIDLVCARVRAEMRDLINLNGWHEPLAEIARTKHLVAHDACLNLLYHRLVLKYNGDTWYDLHPLVAEIPEIRKLVQAPAGALPTATPPKAPGSGSNGSGSRSRD